MARNKKQSVLLLKLMSFSEVFGDWTKSTMFASSFGAVLGWLYTALDK